jgi:hypothetical protein
MGNISLLDVMGSAIIAIFLLATVYSSNARMNETLCTTGSDVAVQQQLVNVIRIVQKDFRRLGYCANQIRIPDPSKAVLSAGAHNISFLTDIDNDGVVDTLKYYCGMPSSLTSTPNPRDMILYRQVNSTNAQAMNIGMTKFDFKFFNANNDSLSLPIADLTAIHHVQLSFQLESTHPYDATYTYAAWRGLQLRARNLRDR